MVLGRDDRICVCQSRPHTGQANPPKNGWPKRAPKSLPVGRTRASSNGYDGEFGFRCPDWANEDCEAVYQKSPVRNNNGRGISQKITSRGEAPGGPRCFIACCAKHASQPKAQQGIGQVEHAAAADLTTAPCWPSRTELRKSLWGDDPEATGTAGQNR